MTQQPQRTLPHHRLVGSQLAFELAVLVHRIAVSDTELRSQARRAAKAAALNAAEGAGRPSLADKARVLAIAAAEAGEAAAAVELAAALGCCSAREAAAVRELAVRVVRCLGAVGRGSGQRQPP